MAASVTEENPPRWIVVDDDDPSVRYEGYPTFRDDVANYQGPEQQLEAYRGTTHGVDCKPPIMDVCSMTVTFTFNGTLQIYSFEVGSLLILRCL